MIQQENASATIFTCRTSTLGSKLLLFLMQQPVGPFEMNQVSSLLPHVEEIAQSAKDD